VYLLSDLMPLKYRRHSILWIRS